MSFAPKVVCKVVTPHGVGVHVGHVQLPAVAKPSFKVAAVPNSV